MSSILHILNKPNFAIPVMRYLNESLGKREAMEYYHSFKCSGEGVFNQILKADPNFRDWLQEHYPTYLE